VQHSSLINRIFKSLFLKVLGSACGFLTIVITAKFLGPQGRGEIALFVNILTLILSFTSTFYSSFSYLIGNLKYKLEDVFNLTIFTTIIFSIILLIIFKFFPYQYGYLIIIVFIFANVVNYMEGIGYAIDNLNLVNLVKNAPSILTFTFMLMFLSFQKNIFLAILSYFISFFVLFLYVILNFWKYFKLKINFDALKTFIKHGIFVALSTSITFLLYRIDFFLIEKFYSKDVLGIYSVSISIGEINFIILSFIITAVAGKFFSNEGKAILKKSILILWIFQILAILFFLIFGKTFINLLFSKEFNSSYLPSIIILLSTAIYNPSSIIAVYLNIKLGKTYIPFIISIISLIIKSILAFFLIKEFSIIGASISSLITYTLTFSIYVFVYFKFIKN